MRLNSNLAQSSIELQSKGALALAISWEEGIDLDEQIILVAIDVLETHTEMHKTLNNDLCKCVCIWGIWHFYKSLTSATSLEVVSRNSLHTRYDDISISKLSPHDRG